MLYTKNKCQNWYALVYSYVGTFINTSGSVSIKICLFLLYELRSGSQTQNGSFSPWCHIQIITTCTLTTLFASTPLNISFSSQVGRSMSVFHQGSPSQRFRGKIHWWSVEDVTGHLTVRRGTEQPSSFPTDTENTTLSSSSTIYTLFCSANNSTMEFMSFIRWNSLNQVAQQMIWEKNVLNGRTLKFWDF